MVAGVLKTMNCKKCAATLQTDEVYCHLCGRKQTITRVGRNRPNGTGTAYKRGKTWTARISVRNDDRYDVHTKGGFISKKDALDYCAILRSGHARPALTFDHYWSLYSENKMKKVAG